MCVGRQLMETRQFETFTSHLSLPQVILELMRELRIDQINFPARNSDGAICT
jgi:hypothetical protein